MARHSGTDGGGNRRAQAALKVRRRCTCGRVITGNAGWWSHTHLPSGAERDGHAYNGMA